MVYYETGGELMHHGIIGMKWGIRRYQNEDGTYTDAGKRRKRNSSDYEEARSIQKKKVSEMSNAELRKVNDRLNLERNYQSLTKRDSLIKKGTIAMAGISGFLATAVALHGNWDKFVDMGKNLFTNST